MLNNKITKSVLIPTLATALVIGAGFVGIASADTTSATTAGVTTDSGTTATQSGSHQGMRPGVMGTVASISGSTITVTGQNETTYTVDASAATFKKSSTAGTAPTTVTISSIAVGDKVAIRGTVSGTTVTATDVMDGIGNGGGHGGPKGGHRPGVTGTVSAVNGNTVTITNSDGISYTVDASSAKITKMETLSVSDIQVGDTVGVEGTVSGTSVSATNIMDGVPTAPHQSQTSASATTATTN